MYLKLLKYKYSCTWPHVCCIHTITHKFLTRNTSYTNILIVFTIMYMPDAMGTFVYGVFIANAEHFIQPYWSTAFSKVSPSIGCPSKAKHSADNICGTDIPEVITNCSPCSVVLDLNSTFGRGWHTSQPDWPLLTCRKANLAPPLIIANTYFHTLHWHPWYGHSY